MTSLKTPPNAHVKKILRKAEDYWYDEREEEEETLDFYEKVKHSDDKINLTRS
ncbi:hypothetical protein KY348_01375 [Candidatus Woesearchaeota archaeon]|nr:hypothetical protein [Candidatus Woesearchaeota archaeon]